MKSKFASSYISSFFLMLLFATMLGGESGLIIGEVLFSLSLAFFFEAAIHYRNIDIKLQILMGVIFVILAIYDLSFISPVYSLCLLGAYIPLSIANVAYFKFAEEQVNTLFLSISEVLIFFLMDFSLSEVFMVAIDEADPGYILAGAKPENLGAAGILYLGALVILWLYGNRKHTEFIESI